MPKRVKPETHQKQKSRYYKRSRTYAFASGARWNDGDVALVLSHEMPDSILCRLIGRSIQAIQMCRINKRRAV
jgi:hypothetical protein